MKVSTVDAGLVTVGTTRNADKKLTKGVTLGKPQGSFKTKHDSIITLPRGKDAKSKHSPPPKPHPEDVVLESRTSAIKLLDVTPSQGSAPNSAAKMGGGPTETSRHAKEDHGAQQAVRASATKTSPGSSPPRLPLRQHHANIKVVARIRPLNTLEKVVLPSVYFVVPLQQQPRRSLLSGERGKGDIVCVGMSAGRLGQCIRSRCAPGRSLREGWQGDCARCLERLQRDHLRLWSNRQWKDLHHVRQRHLRRRNQRHYSEGGV